MKKLHYHLFLLFINIIFLFAQGKLHDQAVLIFIDQTSSISPAEQARWQANFSKYMQFFENKSHMRECAFRFLPIHAQTYSAAPLIEDVSFPMRKGIKYRRIRETALKHVQESMSNILNSSVPKNLNSATDILNSIPRAAVYFDNYPDAVKEIRYYSDMIQWSDEFALITPKFKDADNLDALINIVFDKFDLRDGMLNGININIVKPGVTKKNIENLPVSVVKKIDQFWILLFKKLGAKINGIQNV